MRDAYRVGMKTVLAACLILAVASPLLTGCWHRDRDVHGDPRPEERHDDHEHHDGDHHDEHHE
jgi:hypothetical protein